ncbi:septum formation family protein [Lysinibacter cavernae]|uniref:Tetratricopeptide (TPR) repeat protein n=1 Tax=Lysinibacter cavernae TaxID=1640652 RepID=A0A7X5R3Y2_9MICO|nr:septum formation family protein [Lysinibacter cavernae]NIH55219.1 tetratricopeptide (TPR) repeat protein [Lysinibacter cavernae]
MSDLDTALARAEAMFRLRRHQDAVELLTPLVASHPENAEVAFTLGDAHRLLDNYEQSRHYASEALARDPGSTDGMALLSLVSLELNDLETADRVSQQLLTHEPHTYRASFIGARVTITGWGLASEAVFPKRSVLDAYQQRTDKLVATLLEEYPHAAGTHITHALQLNNIYGRDKAAIAAIKRALTIDPENADAIRILAAFTQSTANSIRLARASLAIDPQNEHAVALACGAAGTAMRRIQFWLLPLTLMVSVLTREWVVLKLAVLIIGLILIAVQFRSEAADGQPLSAAQRRLYRRVRPKRWFGWWLSCGAVIVFNFVIAFTSSPDLTTPLGLMGLIIAVLGGLAYAARGVIVSWRNSKTSRARLQAVAGDETPEQKRTRLKDRTRLQRKNALFVAAPFVLILIILVTRWYSEPEAPEHNGYFTPGMGVLTESVTFRVTVAEGTANYSYRGTHGGKNIDGTATIDSAQQSTVSESVAIDRGSRDFSVLVTSDSADANVTVGCEIEIGGIVTVQQTGAGSVTCDLAAPVETTSATQVLVADNFESLRYAVGDCLTLTTTTTTTSSALVDCATEHDAQVISLTPYTQSNTPSGDNSMNPTNADALCTGDAFTAFIGVPFKESELGTAALYPGATARVLAESNVACLVQSSEGQTTGSLQNASR